jgi:predicted DNA-binding protein
LKEEAMKTIQIRVPDTIHERMKKLAKEEGISMNNFIVSSVSNEVIRQETRDFFKRASERFNPESFAEALAAVPDKPVEGSDKIP